ncbi:hypothetical protein C1N55_15490 [Lysinibacillus sp. SGAir0095]|nr:hypothetical protein C1N55_15490 [Lysinibacillus sp. SGAir0095]
MLEPIWEAKFYKPSYGFKSNRNTHHAKIKFDTLINRACLYHCIDVVIKGFFDNLKAHRKQTNKRTLYVDIQEIVIVKGYT